MRTVRVEREISAPIESVFDVLADHAGYDRFRPVRRSELTRPGRDDQNGVGAVRTVWVGPLRFTEEITVYERPTRLDYLIVAVNVPFEHKGGTIRLDQSGREGTHATWTSTFRCPARLLGGPLTLGFGIALERGFASMLRDTAAVAGS